MVTNELVSESLTTGSIPVACSSTLASYSLPKSVVHLTISSEVGRPLLTLDDAPTRVPDNQFTFCLDHLKNGFADDSVRVEKNKMSDDNKTVSASPFLTLVASHATDRSVDVIRKLILTAFRILSGNAGFTSARSAIGEIGTRVVTKDFAFDPFDQREVAGINNELSPLGFCVVLEDYNFDVYRQPVGKYCDNPRDINASFPSKKATVLRSQHFLIPKPTAGIFYRPRADHAVSVYTNDDPGSGKPWRLMARKWMPFENASPVLSVGIGRAVFATRRTGLIFDQGMLQNVCIAKGSEVAGFVNIPLDIVYGIIALPGQTIQGTVNNFTTRRKLIEAQEQLVAAQEAYIQYLSTPAAIDIPAEVQKGASANLKLGAVPQPSTPAVYDTKLNGDTAAINADSLLGEICANLSGPGKFFVGEEGF
jgi:hypothetical protein